MSPLLGVIYALGALLTAEAFTVATIVDGEGQQDSITTLALLIVAGAFLALMWPFLVVIALIYWSAAITSRAIRVYTTRNDSQ